MPFILLFILALVVVGVLLSLRSRGGKMEPETDRQTAYSRYPDALYPVRKKGKWGYINRLGNVVIPFQYDAAEDFREGRAAVGKISGDAMHYGFIDSTGTVVIELKYARVGFFSEGLSSAREKDKYGYVNKQGVMIIPEQFEEASTFSEGLAAVELHDYVGFINTFGTMVIPPRFTCSAYHPYFHHGLAPVFGADEKAGFIDTTGAWAIDPVYHVTTNFAEGLASAAVQIEGEQYDHGFTILTGYVDAAGNFVIAPQFDFAWDFHNGYAAVWKRSEDKRSKLWKLIDKKGQTILDNLPYQTVGAVGETGLIGVEDESMRWGFINLQGEVIVAPEYSGVNLFRNGMARMEKGSPFKSSMVYINPKGEIVWRE